MGRSADVDQDEKTIRAVRNLRESGGSYVLTIPPEFVELADFEVGDEVEIQGEMFESEFHVQVVDGDEDEDDDE